MQQNISELCRQEAEMKLCAEDLRAARRRMCSLRDGLQQAFLSPAGTCLQEQLDGMIAQLDRQIMTAEEIAACLSLAETQRRAESELLSDQFLFKDGQGLF